MTTYNSFGRHQSNVPVTEPLIGQNQIPNNTGGYVYEVSPFTQLERFLLIGSEGGTYYSGENKLTRENALAVAKCIELDGRRTIQSIVAVSDGGRALDNDPALFALALCASAKDPSTRADALDVLPKVARIPTHLFHFVAFVEQFRGWGRSLKRGIANWYQEQPVDKLAYGMVKYQQRDGWSHRDLLRLSHPKTTDASRNALYSWAVDGPEKEGLNGPLIVDAFEQAKAVDTKELIGLIHKYNLSREMLPTEALTKPEVWEALLQKMPPHALIRNLGNLSKCGLLKPLSDAERLVIDRLSGEDAAQLFAKNRVHPIAILIAMKQYAQGHGMLGKGEWKVSQRTVDALDEAYYLAHKYAEPTGKRFLFGIDVSGSMTWSAAGRTNLQCSEAAMAMALSVAKIEKYHAIYGFANTFKDLGVSPKLRLDQACQITRQMAFGSTNASLPMKFAMENKIPVDVFVIITDNEVNTGSHPAATLRRYREAMNIPAKLVVIACTPTKFTIADPNDPYMVDVAGFDANVPRMVQELARI
jgi:60 kDa SS-A/Ro ribonucleoprotein